MNPPNSWTSSTPAPSRATTPSQAPAPADAPTIGERPTDGGTTTNGSGANGAAGNGVAGNGAGTASPVVAPAATAPVGKATTGPSALRARDRRAAGLPHIAGVGVRSRRLGVSWRAQPRSILVTIVFAALTFLTFAWSLTVGDFPVPFGDVIATIFGTGNSDSEFIIRTLRMPRALAAVLVGAALGLSGGIFQRVARNPLASPDIIGINFGAAAAALFVIVILNGTSSQVTVGALIGAVATASAVYLLAYKKGVTGYRLVLVGIGITAMMQSVVSYLLTRGEIHEAQRAAVWLTGSLNGRGWDEVRPIGWALVVLAPAALMLARQLRALELGDDAARGLGVRVEPVRAGLLCTGVGLAAVAVASAGPIAFVALVAPQIARRLIAERSLALVPGAAVGAFLLVAADLVARRVFAPTQLPVGVVTAILGAPFLLWLLVRANKIGSAG